MSESTLEVLEHLEDQVLTVTLNRPESLNALTQPMMRMLADAMGRAAGDPDVRVVVLAGAGRGFCAGGDRKRSREPDPGDDLAARFASDPAWSGLEMRYDRLRRHVEAARLLHLMPKPTIAMVRGPAVGAGLSLAAACDLRIASETAMFQTGFAGAGYSGDFGGSYTLTGLVGPAKARELYLLNGRVTAAEALALGLVTRVVGDAVLERETRALAAELAAGPATAFRYMKRNLDAARREDLAGLLDLETLHMVRSTQTEDAEEARAAFREKRPPRFRGR